MRVGVSEDGQEVWVDQNPYGAGASRLPFDEAQAFEGEDHLVDGRRRHAEVTLEVDFGGWSAKHDRIGLDKGEILPLLV